MCYCSVAEECGQLRKIAVGLATWSDIAEQALIYIRHHLPNLLAPLSHVPSARSAANCLQQALTLWIPGAVYDISKSWIHCRTLMHAMWGWGPPPHDDDPGVSEAIFGFNGS